MRSFQTGTGKAHGKLILIGEHAVVYQEPAIALPFFPVSVLVRAEKSDDMVLHSALYQGSLDQAPDHLHHISHLISELKKHFNLPSFRVYIESSIPVSSGMGSSAAIASALVQAIFDGMNEPLDTQTLLYWIQTAERIAHGNPSGIDALTTSQNTAWWFIKDTTLEAFDIDLDAVLIVANSGVQGSTKEAVDHVRHLIDHQAQTKQHIEALGQLTHQARIALQQHQALQLGCILTQAHHHLKSLEVSHPLLDEMVETALKAGALGAKMTGGGLGGCIIALAQDAEAAQHIVSALKQHTFAIWTHSLS